MVPDRRPETLARVLVHALTAARPLVSGGGAQRAAWDAGYRLAVAVRAGLRRPGRLSPERALTAAEHALREQGYQPIRESPGTVRLLNCLFQPLSAEATEFVCGLNERLVSGLLDGLDATTARADLASRPVTARGPTSLTTGAELRGLVQGVVADDSDGFLATIEQYASTGGRLPTSRILCQRAARRPGARIDHRAGLVGGHNRVANGS